MTFAQPRSPLVAERKHPVDNARPIRAAQYVRMSTEHQRYSIENQSDTITVYAQARNMQIVRTYADAGKSGLTVGERAGLQQLIRDVENGTSDFSAILVYDVSRWGRFQDADESAYYEFKCRRAKIEVHYCAEVFVNDGTVSSTLMKAIKRAMAAEYSRELSRKVFAGKCRLVELGFRQGGHAGYGLRRLLVDRHGTAKGILKLRESKSLLTDRVILVPGPDDEVQIVREIYRRFIDAKEAPVVIANDLNRRGIRTELDALWTRAVIRDILTNPKYVGVNITNRTSRKLHGTTVRNSPEMWVRRDAAFTPIVEMEVFQRAQETVALRKYHYSEQELLELLRDLLRRQGRLTAEILDSTPGMPSREIYHQRFGGLLEAYRQIGFQPDDKYTFAPIRKVLKDRREQEIASLLTDFNNNGIPASRDAETGLLMLDDNVLVELTLAHCHHTKRRGHRWTLRLNSIPRADITIAARMAPGNQSILDYYIVPRLAQLPHILDVGHRNSFTIDVHRFDDLSALKASARRVTIRRPNEEENSTDPDSQHSGGKPT